MRPKRMALFIVCFVLYSINAYASIHWISNDISPNVCTGRENEIIEELLKVNLHPTIEIYCSNHNSIPLEDTTNKIIDIFYTRDKYHGQPESIQAYYINDSFKILHLGFTYSSSLIKFLMSELKTPFGDRSKWSGFNIDDFIKSTIISEGDNKYCIKHTMLFPFTGDIINCPDFDALKNKEIKTGIITGDVSYIEGEFRWEDAYNIFIQECPKYYSARCTPSINELPLRSMQHFASHPMGGTAPIIKYKPEKYVDSYIFKGGIHTQSGEKTMSGGNEGEIFVQVWKDGSVKSKEIIRKSGYPLSELLSLQWPYSSQENK